MVKLRGHIIRETSEAVLFQVTEDIFLHLNGRTEWFPKSQIRLPKRLDRETISIYVREWIYNDKIRIDERTR